MAGKILIALLLTIALCMTPFIQQEASARIELSELEVQQPKIVQYGKTIIISGAMGKSVTIYNLIGVEIMTVRIDSQEKRIDLSNLGKGIYPVKVGNITKKIHLGGH